MEAMGDSSTLNFILISAKLEALDQKTAKMFPNSEYKRHAGAYSLRDFSAFVGVSWSIK